MSAPPLLRPPGSKNKNLRSPKLRLPTLSVNAPPTIATDFKNQSIYQSQECQSSSSLLSSATSKLQHLDISDRSSSHIQTPSTATSDASLGVFSAEIIAEVEKDSETESSTPCIIVNKYVDDIRKDESTLLPSRHKDVEELDEDEWKIIFKKGEIIELGVLGEGIGGSVTKCKLKNGNRVFALKQIISDTSEETQKQIVRELRFNKSCKSPYIVKYYGMFLNELNASICISMEYMGGKSLDAIYKRIKLRGGIIGEKILGKIAESVLRGLSYLHENRIIHRDIKPQNILLDEKGNIKLCDFGVSGVVVNSLATTFTGTSYYMAPERIQGNSYSVASDVWSLGLTLLEVSMGRFPLNIDQHGSSPIEILSLIMEFEPTFDDTDVRWSESFKSFINYCLKKNQDERPSPRQMLNHPWVVGQSKKTVNMEKFITKCWENET